MLELTHHQQNVDKVLVSGNQLLTSSKISSEEQEEINVQLQLLNERWQELRSRTVDRQNAYVWLFLNSLYFLIECHFCILKHILSFYATHLF